jgi:hypothetical protein
MPRGPKGEKRPADVIGTAVMVGRIATGKSLKRYGKGMVFNFLRFRSEHRLPELNLHKGWPLPDSSRAVPRTAFRNASS